MTLNKHPIQFALPVCQNTEQFFQLQMQRVLIINMLMNVKKYRIANHLLNSISVKCVLMDMF